MDACRQSIWKVLFVCVLAVLALLACKGESVLTHSPLRALGVEDTQALPAQWFTVICDASEASTCAEGAALVTLERVAAEAFLSPGAHLEVWVLAETAAETELVGSIDVPPRAERGRRAVREAQERFLAATRVAICPPLEARLMRRHARRSPIAESIAKTLLTDTHGLPRRLIIASDGREMSAFADFECRPLPTEQDWLTRLHRHGLFTPGSLSGARVHFTLMAGGPIPGRGCAVTVDRELAIRRLWTIAVREAGGAEVTFDTNAITFATTPAPTTAATSTSRPLELPAARHGRNDR